MWIKAKELQVGFIVVLAGHKLKVLGVNGFVGSDDIHITTEIGHNGIKGQTYQLKAWQEIEVLSEKEGE